MHRVFSPLLVAALVAGCSGPSAEPAIDVARADTARMTLNEGPGAAADALNTLGLALYGRVAADDPAANLVISPSSIALALAMARAGARDTTADEMDAVMAGFGSDDLAPSVAALDAGLQGRSGSVTDAMGRERDLLLRSVNVPFAQRGYAIKASYLDALATRFAGALRLVDFKTRPEDARGAINGWVAEQTERRIDELLTEGTIDGATRLVLVNAIYLKAPWDSPFWEGATSAAPFTTTTGTTVQAAMMHGGGDWDYAAGDGWQAAALPYAGGSLSMLAILPVDLRAFEQSLDGPSLRAITGALTPHTVSFSMPRFGADTTLDLGTALRELGMPTAFIAGTADFTGITDEEPLFIGAVAHQANIDVDEEGTEAAAATAVEMAAGAAPPTEIVELVLDRPFLFAVRDTDSGAILFLGRVGTPEAME